jgi:DNA-binding NtrC family response regulator
MQDATSFTLLVVDDEQSVLQSLKRFFAKSGFQVLLANNGQKGLELLSLHHIDLLLLDLVMPGMDGLTVLREAKKMSPALKVIIQTGHGGINEAVEAVKNGASDFLVKGDSPEILRTRVGLIHEQWQLRMDNKVLRGENNIFDFDKLTGASSAMTKLKEMIVRVAPTETTVLIQGESGTGKELVAQALHHHSQRRNRPYIVVDCATISETVIESELFGHEKGAFTGADTSTGGLVRAADTGTLFFDEIGELSPGVQAKLLRIIQERTVRPVGSTKNHQVDIRIIAATNRNLLEEAAEKRFRQDLYYRLSTVTLTVPPLREREGDIAQLTSKILAYYHKAEAPVPSVTDRTQQLLDRYDWPGNVRELENVLRGALVFADEGKITPRDLPPAVGVQVGSEETKVKNGSLAAYELAAIKNALAEAGNNRSQAAKILDIAEATLYRKIKNYRL